MNKNCLIFQVKNFLTYIETHMDTKDLNEKHPQDDEDEEQSLKDYKKSVEKSDTEKKCVLYM